MRPNIRRRAKKRLWDRVKWGHFASEAANQVRSLVFMHNSLGSGRSFRLLNAMEDFNQEVL
jgi:putative transposase